MGVFNNTDPHKRTLKNQKAECGVPDSQFWWKWLSGMATKWPSWSHIVRHCTHTVLRIWIKIMKTTFSLFLNCWQLDWKSFLRLFVLVRLIVCPNLMSDDLALTSDCSLYYSNWIFAKLVFLLNVPTFYSFKGFGLLFWWQNYGYIKIKFYQHISEVSSEIDKFYWNSYIMRVLNTQAMWLLF